MSPQTAVLLAAAILAVHLGVVIFNLFGMVAVPLGGWLGWRFVRVRWWRALHVAAWAAVAGQALFGRACFLTLWQDALLGREGPPLVMGWIDRLLFWPLPM